MNQSEIELEMIKTYDPLIAAIKNYTPELPTRRNPTNRPRGRLCELTEQRPGEWVHEKRCAWANKLRARFLMGNGRTRADQPAQVTQ